MTATPTTPVTFADLKTLAGTSLGIPVEGGASLAGGGSQREFYRLRAAGRPAVGAIGRNRAEVRAFLGFTRHFAARGIPVPRILGEDAGRGLYLMEDLGEATLADRLRQWRAAPDGAARAEDALTTVVRWLPVIQVRGGAGLDPALFHEGAELDGAVFRADVERFLRHYLPRFALRPAPLEGAGRAALNTLLERLGALPRAYFCYRDFQTRNIMWVAREGEQAEGPVFLDYQSGRRGPVAYDLASLLYSPDTGADEPLRARLIDAYLSALAGCGAKLERTAFLAGFYPIVLVRRLQALGAYAQLAVEGGRSVYLERIPPALADLRALQAAGRFDFGLPALEAWLALVLATD